MKYEVVSIRNTLTGEMVNISIYEFTWVGKDYAIGRIKGYGFSRGFSKADCYEVITKEKVEA